MIGNPRRDGLGVDGREEWITRLHTIDTTGDSIAEKGAEDLGSIGGLELAPGNAERVVAADQPDPEPDTGLVGQVATPMGRGHENGTLDIWLGLEEKHLGQLGTERCRGTDLIDRPREDRAPERLAARLDQHPSHLAAGALTHNHHL